MKDKKLMFGLFINVIFLMSLGNALAQERPERGEKHKPPTFKELLKELDANEDGKLSEKEAKGPLKDHFAKIDANEDGFITEEEFKKAPKPNGKRPPRRNI